MSTADYHHSKTVPVGQKEPVPLPIFIPGGALHWKRRRDWPGEPEETLQHRDTPGNTLQTTWVGCGFANLWNVISNGIDCRNEIHNSTHFASLLFWIRKIKFSIIDTKKGTLGSNLLCFTWTWCSRRKSRLKLRNLELGSCTQGCAISLIRTCWQRQHRSWPQFKFLCKLLLGRRGTGLVSALAGLR